MRSQTSLRPFKSKNEQHKTYKKGFSIPIFFVGVLRFQMDDPIMGMQVEATLVLIMPSYWVDVEN